MLNIKEKIVEYFDSLTYVGKLAAMIAVVGLLIIFYLVFIRNNYRENDIDYRQINSTKIIEYSSIVYDRDEILVLDNVIDNILKIKDSTWIVNQKPITVNELYSQAVTENYKKEVSKREFRNLLNQTFVKVLGEDGKYTNINYLDTVYYSDTYNTYLIKLISNDSDSNSYIGIRLTDEGYLITYVE